MGKRTSIWLEEKDALLVERIARRKDRTFAYIVREAVKKYINAQWKKLE